MGSSITPTRSVICIFMILCMWSCQVIKEVVQKVAGTFLVTPKVGRKRAVGEPASSTSTFNREWTFYMPAKVFFFFNLGYCAVQSQYSWKKFKNFRLNHLEWEDLPRSCLMFSWHIVKNIYHAPFWSCFHSVLVIKAQIAVSYQQQRGHVRVCWCQTLSLISELLSRIKFSWSEQWLATWFSRWLRNPADSCDRFSVGPGTMRGTRKFHLHFIMLQMQDSSARRRCVLGQAGILRVQTSKQRPTLLRVLWQLKSSYKFLHTENTSKFTFLPEESKLFIDNSTG